MKVNNIHTRILHQPKERAAELFGTLTSENDGIWPLDKWPPMKLKEGLKEGSEGGHGPIGYVVQKYVPGELIQFQFTRPGGFNGFHQFELNEIGLNKTELRHTIKMNATGISALAWVVGIRWLHDALVEDLFDKVENHFSAEKKKTEWGFWVKALRGLAGKQQFLL